MLVETEKKKTLLDHVNESQTGGQMTVGMVDFCRPIIGGILRSKYVRHLRRFGEDMEGEAYCGLVRAVSKNQIPVQSKSGCYSYIVRIIGSKVQGFLRVLPVDTFPSDLDTMLERRCAGVDTVCMENEWEEEYRNALYHETVERIRFTGKERELCDNILYRMSQLDEVQFDRIPSLNWFYYQFEVQNTRFLYEYCLILYRIIRAKHLRNSPFLNGESGRYYALAGVSPHEGG